MFFRRVIVIALGTLLLAALGTAGYGTAVALAPLQALTPVAAHATPESITVDGAEAQAIVDAETLPTGFGWLHSDETWVNDDAPHPLASLTKLVTVLVCQDRQPIDLDNPGTYTWTWDDVAVQSKMLANEAVIIPVDVGTEISRIDILRGALLPSAADFVTVYANSVFDSNEELLAAAADWATRHGLTSLTYVEPTGLDSRNQASVHDLVKIARLVLNDPVLSSIVRQTEAYIPNVGYVESTNPLLGIDPRVIGLKTGTLFETGYHLISAAEISGVDRELTAITVSLSRDSREQRAADGQRLLDLIGALPREVSFDDELTIGSVETWEGDSVAIHTEPAGSFTLVPGETITRTTSLLPVSGTVNRGSVVGEITVEYAGRAVSRDASIASAISEPDYWWRFQNPGATLFHD